MERPWRKKVCAAAIKIRAGRKGPKKPAHQGKKTFTKNKATERKVAKLDMKVENQRRQLAAMAISKSASESNEYNGEEEEPMNDSQSNSNHSAITRQGQGRKKKSRTQSLTHQSSDCG